MSTLFALELPRVRMEKKRQKGRDIKEEDELEQKSRKSFIHLL